MSLEIVTGAFAAALVAIVTGLLSAFWKVWTDREKLHVEEVKRKEAEVELEREQCEREKQNHKNDLIQSRLYNAELEKKLSDLERNNDAWRTIASTLRDKLSMLQTTLANHNINVPDDRRNVTKPLDAMLAEHLENQRPNK